MARLRPPRLVFQAEIDAHEERRPPEQTPVPASYLPLSRTGSRETSVHPLNPEEGEVTWCLAADCGVLQVEITLALPIIVDPNGCFVRHPNAARALA